MHPTPEQPASGNSRRILLINLGGPRNSSEVEIFLRDLLTDPLMVDMPLPFFLQRPLMSFVARRRARRVIERYESLGFGGGSPLVSETERQGRALCAALRELQPDTNWRVEVAMSCGRPNLRDGSQEGLLASASNILVPLYPQFSRSTTMSTARLIFQKTATCPLASRGTIGPFYSDNRYIEAIAGLITNFLSGKISEQESKEYFISPDVPPAGDWRRHTILFSAHGIPLRLVKKGDVYPRHVEENAVLLTRALRKAGFRGETHLSYQSRLGPGKWTTPSTIDKLKELGKGGHKTVCVYPISFVSDHLETLEEIQTELRLVARESGIAHFHRIPAPGTWPPFIRFLAHRILEECQDTSLSKQCCHCQSWGGESLYKYKKNKPTVFLQ